MTKGVGLLPKKNGDAVHCNAMQLLVEALLLRLEFIVHQDLKDIHAWGFRSSLINVAFTNLPSHFLLLPEKKPWPGVANEYYFLPTTTVNSGSVLRFDYGPSRLYSSVEESVARVLRAGDAPGMTIIVPYHVAKWIIEGGNEVI